MAVLLLALRTNAFCEPVESPDNRRLAMVSGVDEPATVLTMVTTPSTPGMSRR